MRPSVVSGPLTDRVVDALDVAVVEAMLLQALGPNTDAMRVSRAAGHLVVELSPLGRATLREMAVTSDVPELDAWLEILTPGLVEEAVAVTGEDWRSEAELGVELACSERSDDAGALAALAASAPLRVDTSASVGELLADRVCDPVFAALIV